MEIVDEPVLPLGAPVALGPDDARADQVEHAVHGLLASTSITEAITSEFVVPGPLAALDGTTIPGTGLRFRVARNARTLAVVAETAPDAALARLRRLGPGELADACRRMLEAGTVSAVFWDEIAGHGLRVPASWLTHGGWPALWTRAHR